MATIIGKVYETTDYEKFSFVIGNRAVKTKGMKWSNLLDSIKAHGQLEPALVNEKFEVINGQHRLMCCKELEIPFRYTIGKFNASGELIGEANRSNKWGMREYINFYANQTDARAINYKYLEALRSEFHIGDSALTVLVQGGTDGTKTRQDIEKGKLKISSNLYNTIRECLTDVYALGFDKWLKENRMNARTYWAAVTYAWRNPDVDMKRLIKVMWENEFRVPSTSKTTELLRAMSEIYNRRLAKVNRIYMDQDWDRGKYRKWDA